MRKHAELIKQWAGDETLEIECLQPDGTWYLVPYPSWQNEQTYRIKPKKKVEMWQWAMVLNNDVTPKKIITSQFYANVDFLRQDHLPDHWKIICRIEGSRIEVEK